MKSNLYLMAGSLGFLAILIWRLYDNLRKNRNDVRIDHKKETKLRTLLLAPVILVLSCVNPWWTVLESAPLVMVWWVTIFDGMFGVCRRRGFWDLGTEDGRYDAWTDRLFRRMGTPWHQITKIGACALTLFLYLKTIL